MIAALLTLLAAGPMLLALVLLVEVLAALTLGRRSANAAIPAGPRPSVAVLVPAHNESTGLLPTLADIRGQLQPRDRLLVVADNCTDDTAEAAVSGGAEVAVRTNTEQRGKGYALEFGVRHLEADPRDVLVIIDADCRVAPDAIDRMAATVAASARPVQALDLMLSPPGSPINHQVAELAWRVKNMVRPTGLAALGLPSHLMGTGMALPWNIVRSANLGQGGHLTEDIALGLELAAAGTPAVFCPDALVTSHFPTSPTGTETQRQRWEHGHLTTIVSLLPRLAVRAIRERNWPLLALTLDMSIPPLSLFAVITLASFLITGLIAVAGIAILPFRLATIGLAAVSVTIGLVWLAHGRDLIPLSRLKDIPLYALRKLGLYRAFASKSKDATWVRTDRE